MKLHTLPCLALSLLLLAGCTAQAEPVEATFFAMDTVMTLQVYGADQALLDQLREEVLRLEGLWSVTDENSEIYAADHAGGQPVTVSEDTADLLSQALAIGRATGGALSLTIYPVVRSWGFTTGEYRVPSQEELDALLPLVDDSRVELDGTTLTLPEGVELDLGAVAKGYTGERLAQLLRDAGVTSALLDLGGNIQTVGGRSDGGAWRVAVRDPEGEDYAAVLEVEDQAVVTSGGILSRTGCATGTSWTRPPGSPPGRACCPSPLWAPRARCATRCPPPCSSWGRRRPQSFGRPSRTWTLTSSCSTRTAR